MYEKFSAVYEQKIREDFSYPQMAAFVRRRVSEKRLRVMSALDLGCGTGNASQEMAKDFGQLVLCDPSPDMLALAREKFRPPYLPLFLQASAESVHLPGRFDLIYSVLDVLNYLTPSQAGRCLAACYTNLKAKGLVIFDISSPHKLEQMGKTGTFVYDDEDYFHVWENELHTDHLDLTLNLFVRSGSSDLYERITEEQTMYLHWSDPLEQSIRRAGFKLQGCYDGYSEKPAHPGSSRLVYVLEKETE